MRNKVISIPQPKKVIYDMETKDPDDLLTLLWLIGNPSVELRAVTITPGTPDQVRFVKHVLSEFGLTIPVGSFNYDHPKPGLADWYKAQFPEYTKTTKERPETGDVLIARISDENTIIITGGPLNNLAKTLQEHPEFKAEKLVIQGGFAGEGVIPREMQLEKFAGKTTCESFNLNSDPAAALTVISSEKIPKFFVSKNVCHDVKYTPAFHEKLKDGQEHPSALKKLFSIMENYLSKKPAGKLLHDPLTASCAIEPEIGSWEKIILYQSGNEWGSTKTDSGNTWIITSYKPEIFLGTFNYTSA